MQASWKAAVSLSSRSSLLPFERTMGRGIFTQIYCLFFLGRNVTALQTRALTEEEKLAQNLSTMSR